MRLVLDTNILISAVIKNSTNREILLLPDFEFLLPEYTFEDSKQFKVDNIAELVKDNAKEIFKKYTDKDYSFTDCISFAHMKTNGIKKVFTFDEHFKHFGFELVV